MCTTHPALLDGCALVPKKKAIHLQYICAVSLRSLPCCGRADFGAMFGPPDVVQPDLTRQEASTITRFIFMIFIVPGMVILTILQTVGSIWHVCKTRKKVQFTQIGELTQTEYAERELELLTGYRVTKDKHSGITEGVLLAALQRNFTLYSTTNHM